MARCIFCGKRPLTKEHIFPKWLAPYIPKTMENYQNVKTIFHKDRTDTATKRRSGDPHSLSVKCVCKKCNNEWMGALQERVKPILLPMIKGEKAKIEKANQHVVASWVAMATMCAEFSDRKTVAIADADRQWLWKTHTAPPRWRIWIGHYRRGHWLGQYIHTSIPISAEEHVVETADGDVPAPNTQTTTLVVGQVYIHVLSSQMGWVFDRVRLGSYGLACLSPIWPIEGDIMWPTRTMTDSEADALAAALFTAITGISPKASR